MENKISALIFSMNKVDSVIKLCKKLKYYVDEIVVVDSSRRDKFELLRRKIPYAKVFYLPPIGVADFYYKVALDLVSYNWVIHLDDDEEPNWSLIVNLRNIIQNTKCKVFAIRRFDTRTNTVSLVIRIFHKSYIYPTGCLHWCWAAIGDYCILDKKYYIVHNTSELASFRKRIARLVKYAVMESYYIGYKTHFLLYKNNNIKVLGPPSNSVVIGFLRKLYCLLLKLLGEEYGLVAFVSFYNLVFGPICILSSFLFCFRDCISNKNLMLNYIEEMIYIFLIQYFVLKDLKTKIKIWKKVIEIGNPFVYMNLNGIDRIYMCVYTKNGLSNFVKLNMLRI